MKRQKKKEKVEKKEKKEKKGEKQRNPLALTYNRIHEIKGTQK